MESLFLKTVLCINTATHREGVSIIQNNKELANVTWESNKNESSVLLKGVDRALTKAKCSYTDIDAIIAVTGPGPFSAVRIGTATANALGLGLNKPVYAMSMEALWYVQKESYKTKEHENIFVVMSAGKGNVALLNFDAEASMNAETPISDHPIIPLRELVKMIEVRSDSVSGVTLLCDVTSAEKQLLLETCPAHWKIYDETDTKFILSFGKAVLKLPSTLIYHPESNIVTPRYLRPPTITQAKKPLYVTP